MAILILLPACEPGWVEKVADAYGISHAEAQRMVESAAEKEGISADLLANRAVDSADISISLKPAERSYAFSDLLNRYADAASDSLDEAIAEAFCDEAQATLEGHPLSADELVDSLASHFTSGVINTMSGDGWFSAVVDSVLTIQESDPTNTTLSIEAFRFCPSIFSQ
jgi:hypothetical protein